MANPPSNQFVDYPIFNQLVPKEGPKTVPFTFDFTAQNQYLIDLQNQQSRSFISIVQSIYVRNPGTVTVTIIFDVAGQQIDFPPQSAGYLPVLVTNPPRFSVTSSGGASNVQLQLLNVPMPAAIWPLVTYIPPISSGALVVADTILDGAVSGGFMQSRQFVTDQSDNVVPRFFACQNFLASITAAGATTIAVAGGAAVGMCVTDVDITLSGNAALAAPGNLTISIRYNAAAIMTWIVSLPAVANTPIISVVQKTGIQWLAGTTNHALDINLSAALTAGTLQANIGWMYTATLR